MDNEFPLSHFEVELDLEDVHEQSVRILELLAEEDATLGVGAVALTLGRLLSPTVPMDPEDEVKFVQDLMEWCMMYFVHGESN